MSSSPSDQVIAAHDAYMTHNYARFPVVISRGHGSELWDVEGARLVDLFSGFGAPLLGHCHPDLVKTLHEQSQQLWHVGNLLHTEPQTQLAQYLHQHSGGMHSFFCHSGADANEAAIKLARLYGLKNPGSAGNRHHIITAEKSFHGRTLATIQATGNPAVREGFEPHMDGFSHVPWGDVNAIREAITPKTVAIMLEPIQGEGGVNLPPEDYLENVQALCHQHDLLFICDEVWTGCARTGRAFGHQHWAVRPDIMTLAKGVGGGMPLGVMLCSEALAPLYDWANWGRAMHATTLGGSPLVTAVAARIWEVIDRDDLIAYAEDTGHYLSECLEGIKERTGTILDIRGKGLFQGVTLAVETLPDHLDSATAVVRQCLRQGLLINATQGNTLRIAPALTISRELLDEGLDILENVLSGK